MKKTQGLDRRSSVRRLACSSACAVVALVPALVWIPTASAAPGPKVRICHRTQSATNPFVSIIVAQSAADGTKGAGDHFSTHPADIIPPIPGFHDGLNWDADGIVLWAGACRAAKPVDTDMDGVLDVLDRDDDGDSIPDATDTDDDNDGVTDSDDDDQAKKSDIDRDGIPDAVDSDDDGDGIRDTSDNDRDGDSLPDTQDGDLTPQPSLGGSKIPTSPPTPRDQDGDGIANERDADADGDGVAETQDQQLPESVDIPADVEVRGNSIAIDIPDKTASGQRVSVSVRCSKGAKRLRAWFGQMPTGDTAAPTSRQLCGIKQSAEGVVVTLRTSGPTDISVRLSAPAHGRFRPLSKTYETRVT